MVKAQTLKGFRDFLPKEAKKRQFVISNLKSVFESYGFEPLETPALEYEEVLLGKYGEEGDKLMYRFTDNGGRKVALRYDQTVPLARVVAQYGSAGSPQVLPMPFKRYQIQPVWRAENTQKGRFREFLQCDADIVGTNSPLADSEAIAVVSKGLEALGFKTYKVIINDRSIFSNIPKGIITTIDKLGKIGEEEVLSELIKKGFAKDINESTMIFRNIKEKSPTENINKIISYLKKIGIDSRNLKFSPTLARGLDYYTGLIFEIEIDGYSAGSVCGGGRYDNLIGMFAKRDIPAVGFAFGFDRLMEAMDELKLFPSESTTTKVLVTVFSPELKDKSIELTSQLRSNDINTELYLDENASLEKQLKYADSKGVPFAIIIGPQEAEKGIVMLKNLTTREQKEVTQEQLSNELT